MIAARRVFLFLVVALLGGSARVARAQSASCRDNPGHTVTTCRIDRPVVTQRAFQYRAIVFRPGDVVTIDAGGCVATSHSADSWRRFVDPSGPNSNRLFHGLIRLPGHPAGGGLVRVQTLVGRPLTIPTPLPPGNSFLSVGYEDSDYRDNGYSRHDNGPGDQCRLDRDGGPAWVSLAIRHSLEQPLDLAPLDLVATDLDANGALLNPRFFWETRHDGHPDINDLCDGFPYQSRSDESRGVSLGSPPCTKELTGIDVASGFNAVLCRASGAPDRLHGHANLQPATVWGRVSWAGHSDWIQKGDDDYNFRLYPANGGLLTSAHPNAIDVEFDSEETADRFGSAWWRTFHDAVDKDDGAARETSAASQMVDDHEAIVTGLAGISADHDAASQLHPVYAMALHLSSSPGEDRWAFFARNWGNQGFCSSDQHYWDVSPLSLFIPGPDGATGFSLVDHDVKSNRDLQIGASFTNGGLLLSLDLGAPESRAIADGSLRIRWTVLPPSPPAPRGAAVAMGSARVRGASPTFGPSIRTSLAPRQSAGGRTEDLTLTAGLDAGRVAQIRKQLARPAVARNGRSLQIARTAPPGAPPPRGGARPTVRDVPDTAKLEKENRRANAICAAQRANLPSLTAACSGARR